MTSVSVVVPCYNYGRYVGAAVRSLLADQPGIDLPEVVMRTATLKRVGGFTPKFEQANDTELWMRLAAGADVGYVRGVDQAYYRVHPTSMSTRRPLLVDLSERKARPGAAVGGGACLRPRTHRSRTGRRAHPVCRRLLAEGHEHSPV